MTKYRSLSSWNNNAFAHSSGGYTPESNVLAGSVSFGHFSCCMVDSCLLSLFSHGLPSLCLCPNFLLMRKTVILDYSSLELSLLTVTSLKTYLQIQSHSELLGDKYFNI